MGSQNARSLMKKWAHKLPVRYLRNGTTKCLFANEEIGPQTANELPQALPCQSVETQPKLTTPLPNKHWAHNQPNLPITDHSITNHWIPIKTKLPEKTPPRNTKQKNPPPQKKPTPESLTDQWAHDQNLPITNKPTPYNQCTGPPQNTNCPKKHFQYHHPTQKTKTNKQQTHNSPVPYQSMGPRHDQKTCPWHN